MEEYNPKVDYKKLHCEWVREKKGFRPKGGNPLPLMYKTYLDYLSGMYYGTDATFKRNETAYLLLKDDYNWAKRSANVVDEVAVMFGDVPKNDNPSYFVTFNWSPDCSNFNPEHAVKGVQRLFSKSWVDNARGVFEYHGLHGNHPHFMCIIQVNKYKKKYDFKDKILESSLAKGLAANFIDIKPCQEYHQDYLDLDKSSEKQECLEKDVIWRNENNLLHEYKK